MPRCGPLEWRLPESHAIYWAAEGLKRAEANPTRTKPDDLITLRRVIYQSMQLSFQRGRLVYNPFVKAFESGPNLDIIPKVSAAYEQAAEEDKPNHDHILRAHRNFLRDAVYFLYGHNRVSDAAYWYKYLGAHYPNQTLLDGQTNSFPRNVTLGQYAEARVQEDVGDTNSHDRVKSAIEALLTRSYSSLAIGEDERAAGYQLLAQQVRAAYEDKTKVRGEALAMAPLDEIDKDVRNRFLDPEHGAPFEVRAAVRYKLGLPPEILAKPATTNAPPEKVSAK